MSDNDTPEEPKPNDERPKSPFTPDPNRSFLDRGPIEPRQRQKPEQSDDISPRAMFDNAALYNDNPELWDYDAALRIKRFNEIFLPNIKSGSSMLSESAKEHLGRWVNDLKVLSETPFDELPGVTEYSDKVNSVEIAKISSIEDESYIISGKELNQDDMTPENSAAAELFLKSLMPELGFGIDASWDELQEKIALLKESGFIVPSMNRNTASEFVVPTILPGLRVLYFNLSEFDNPDTENDYSISVHPPIKA